ncbi:UNVERIFIED_CONTAM: hypothetical protein GTU68_002493 [Idotea baltica]|nr:hypothetical protein [Idotea baltica]MCL4137210.1 hypothetical protein [Idotea baltica]
MISRDIHHFKPIGIVKSLHKQKNGTPRQGAVSCLSRATLRIGKDIYNNPSHSLEGLSEYSHVWLIYIFHQNTSDGSHAKVAPPRLDGSKLGVFSTRSPHRANPIGLTLAKLDSVEGDTLMLSGIDILDGTPVLDVKPYIPQYDSPSFINNNQVPDTVATGSDLNCVASISPDASTNINEVSQTRTRNSDCGIKLVDATVGRLEINLNCDDDTFQGSTDSVNSEEPSLNSEDEYHPENNAVVIPQWLNSPPSSGLKVVFNPIAEHQIKCFSMDAEDSNFRLEYLKSDQELRGAISSVLSEDPRSTYRRHKCPDRLYFFMVDSAHITTCFFGDVVEVLRVCPPDKENPCYKLI